MPTSTPVARRAGKFAPGSLALGLTVVLALSSTPGLAWAAAPEPAEAPEAETPEAEAGTPEAEAGTPEAEADPLQPTVTEVEEAPAPTGGGVAGAVIDPDDPNATRAQSDLEGESLDTTVEGVPERLPKLQAAGWWTTFSAVALATAGGVFAGVAEARQDEAERLAYAFDLNTGRAVLYADVADDYEKLVREGETFQWLSRGFLIAGGATLIAGITLFALDGARRRKATRSGASARVRLDPSLGGLRLRF